MVFSSASPAAHYGPPGRILKRKMKTSVELAFKLKNALSKQRFGTPVSVVYNPLDYAWNNHQSYLERYASGPRRIVFLGMNPGPWGMAQTGVPFGDPESVRTILGIDGEVNAPSIEHPKRKIVGCHSQRREVSGHRVWSWVREAWGGIEPFTRACVIMNYCPLAFLEDSGRNRTPDKLPKAERSKLFATCDDILRQRITLHDPDWVIAFGTFAEGRARAALKGFDVQIGRVLHPSPASPRANRGWTTEVAHDLAALGIQWPGANNP